MDPSIPIQVAAVVPFGVYGTDELLLMPADGTYRLPAGAVLPAERVLDAASRIVLDVTGLQVGAVRLLYVLESDRSGVTFGVLCEPGDSGFDDQDLRGEIVRLSTLERDFQPVALLDILVEDLRSGFVRPVAHVVETQSGTGRIVDVSW
jgi:hypothetical protein